MELFASVFDVDAAEQHEERAAARRASVLANTRARQRFASFIEGARTREERIHRLSYIRDDLNSVVAQTCEEVGHDDPESIVSAIVDRFSKAFSVADYPTQVISSIHEALGRKDYNMIADRIKTAPIESGHEDLANHFADELEGSNERFDRDRFVKAALPDEDNDTQKSSSVRESRRPKMCPYHSEVTDISLSSGDARAGYEAMAQHAWGPNHCQGGEYDGRCNFRREMVTQKYWDDKQQQADERRDQREQEFAQQPTQEPLQEAPQAPEADIDADGGPDISQELSEAPSAVGSPEPMPMAASRKTAEGGFEIEQLTDGSGNFKVVDADGAPRGMYDTRQEAQKEADALNRTVSSVREGGPYDLVNNPAIQQQQNDPALLQHLQQQGLGVKPEQVIPGQVPGQVPGQAPGAPGQVDPTTGLTPDQMATQMPGQVPGQAPYDPNDPRRQAASDSAQEHQELERGQGPVPQMDKTKWKPNALNDEGNLDPIETEVSNSAYPTREQDIQESPEYEYADNSFHQQTDAQLEHNAPNSKDPHTERVHTDTWSGTGEQAPPVTSAIHDLLANDYDGFIPHSTVQSAIAEYEEQ